MELMELRTRMQKYEQVSIAALRDKLKELKKPGGRFAKELTFKIIKGECPKITFDSSKLSRFINNENTSLTSQDHSALVNFLFEKGYWTERPDLEKIKSVDDYLFHAMTLYLNIGEATINSVDQRAAGNYVVFRPSIHRLGEVIRGCLKISKTSSGALLTTEYHCFSGHDGSKKLAQTFDGYLLRKDKKYFLFGQDVAQRGLRITYINGVLHQSKEISVMHGAALELFMEHVVALPVYCERTDKPFERLKAEADILPVGKTPSTVMQYLEDFRTSHNLIRF